MLKSNGRYLFRSRSISASTVLSHFFSPIIPFIESTLTSVSSPTTDLTQIRFEFIVFVSFYGPLLARRMSLRRYKKSAVEAESYRRCEGPSTTYQVLRMRLVVVVPQAAGGIGGLSPG